MSFLEANKILANFSGGQLLSIHISTSSNIEPLLLYVRAESAKHGYKVELSTLPFGTLGQTLVSTPAHNKNEVLFLLPWDLVPECDWRSGIPSELSAPDVLIEQAKIIVERIKKRQCKIIYLPAPIPPIYLDSSKVTLLTTGLINIAAESGAHLLEPEWFSLASYLASGVPVTGVRMSGVAEIIVMKCIEKSRYSAKVLVTDLDNVLWSGLIAEDGIDGIQCSEEGTGFRHFIYQSFLAKLKANGVLIAAVSRNDINVACSPIKAGKTLLSESDFIEILASYEPKSVHIRRLSETYNLGLDAFVFVDDNPIELAEVNIALPQVKCLQFPEHDDQYADFLNELSLLFNRCVVSDEDKNRTEMYRLRRDAVNERSFIEKEGGDLTEYLASLRMELTIYDCSKYNRERAIQLINKTNQFNLNGRRVANEDISDVLAAGGKLYTVKLEDRSGSHGEILACLINNNGVVLSLVLSCRVFQRNIEHIFLCWLIRTYRTAIKLSYEATDKNIPVTNFLMHSAFFVKNDMCFIDTYKYLADHEYFFNIFNLKEIDFD